jgi:hypothetical protein
VQNQPEAARSAFVEGLSIAYQNDAKIYVVYNIIGMACLFQDQGKLQEAVIMLAASDQIANSLGLKIEPELQEPYDKALAKCQEKFSEQDFEITWQAGRNMEFEQAVKFALRN